VTTIATPFLSLIFIFVDEIKHPRGSIFAVLSLLAVWWLALAFERYRLFMAKIGLQEIKSRLDCIGYYVASQGSEHFATAKLVFSENEPHQNENTVVLPRHRKIDFKTYDHFFESAS